jgi:predicted DNA binding CopG/RHH family protein
MEKPMKLGKLPRTDSIHELAKFWDTHDLTDFEDELEEVTEPVFVRDTHIKVYLQSSDAEAVQQIAQAKGVSREDLIREWVLQKLARRKGRPTKRCS